MASAKPQGEDLAPKPFKCPQNIETSSLVPGAYQTRKVAIGRARRRLMWKSGKFYRTLATPKPKLPKYTFVLNVRLPSPCPVVMGGSDWFNWFRREKSPQPRHGRGVRMKQRHQEHKKHPTASLSTHRIIICQHPQDHPAGTPQGGCDGPGSLPCSAPRILGKRGRNRLFWYGVKPKQMLRLCSQPSLSLAAKAPPCICKGNGVSLQV